MYPDCIFTRQLYDEMGPHLEDVNYICDYIFIMEVQNKYGFILSKNPGCGFRSWAESCTASNKDELRNFREMYIFYKRNESNVNLKIAKYLYLFRWLIKVLKKPSLRKEFSDEYAPLYL